jgi:hypothetical protein
VKKMRRQTPDAKQIQITKQKTRKTKKRVLLRKMMMEDSGSLSQDIFAALQGMDPSATMTTGTASSFLNSLGMSAQTASAASGPSAEDLLMNTPGEAKQIVLSVLF